MVITSFNVPIVPLFGFFLTQSTSPKAGLDYISIYPGIYNLKTIQVK
jgi:hypothetical protein